MKSTRYSLLLLAISIFTALCCGPAAKACGPFPPIVPTPTFFSWNQEETILRYSDRQENLRLWQQLTSDRIPLQDIEEAVYKDSHDKAQRILWSHEKTDNRFYNYIINTNDTEIADFLLTAKTLEEDRAKQVSPWYYPATREPDLENGDFASTISRCRTYKGTRLKDRFALQMVRALFSSRAYKDCIEYFDEAFGSFPDDNLFKRMSMRYVAGCWSRIGLEDKADSCFALAGDYSSILARRGPDYLASMAPDCPELMAYIQEYANDSTFFCSMRGMAENVLKGKSVKNRGDWEFMLAYMDGEFNHDYRKASLHIGRAMRSSFSSEDSRNHAYAYRIKVDAANNNISRLYNDLRWFEGRIDLQSNDANEWNRMLQNIVYLNWIPNMWKRSDYATAILLCGYAENLVPSRKNYDKGWIPISIPLKELRTSQKYYNPYDYGGLTFQLMGSLTSSQLIAVKNRINSGSSLYSFLRRYARTDAPYFNELIGTLALREENYSRAMTYLSKVPLDYQRTMNIYKDGCLSRNPFCYQNYEYDKGNDILRFRASSKDSVRLKSSDNAKYNFAKAMLGYQRTMKYGKSADERGIARLKYAIGRCNSFELCWALTQYWRGSYVKFEPMLYYWPGDYLKSYSFLYEYETPENHEATLARFDKEKDAALSMLKSDEAKAEAEYILGNFRTIIKKYSDTPTAQQVKTSCDNWKDWI